MSDYDHQKDTIKGDKVFLFIDDVPIAFGTSATLDLGIDTIDASSNMSGQWKSAVSGQLNWKISSDSLLSRKSGHLSFDTLLEMQRQGTAINIVWASVGSDFKADEIGRAHV